MHAIKRAAFVAAGLVALAGCATPAPQVDTAADEAAVRAINPAWFAAHKAGDVDALVALHAEDAIVSPPDAAVQRGREAIREGFVAEIAAMTAAGLSNHAGDSPMIRVSGDIGWEWNTYAVKDAAGAPVETGKYMTIFGRRNGTWAIVGDMWNRDAPAEAPAVETAAPDAGTG